MARINQIKKDCLYEPTRLPLRAYMIVIALKRYIRLLNKRLIQS